MRHPMPIALLWAFALVALAPAFVPGCLGPYLETPAEWRAQRAALRQRAHEAVAMFDALYGDLPVEEWPEVLHRETYRNAKRILDELGGEP